MSHQKIPEQTVLERLSEMMRRLHYGEKLSIKALSDEFRVDTKTIQRDLHKRLPDLLHSIHPDIHIEKEGRLFVIKKDNAAKLANFEELLVFDTLEKLSSNIGGSFAARAKKILGRAKTQKEDAYLYASVKFEDLSQTTPDVKSIKNAIEEKKVINFIYKKEKSSYQVNAKPLKIINFDGFWYLLAEDTLQNIIKKYYLTSISNTHITDEHFEVEQGLLDKLDGALNIWFDANSEPFEVTLYADKEIAPHLRRRPLCKNQKILTTDFDGGMELSAQITDYREIVGEVLKWIPHLYVLTPQIISEDIEERIQAYLQGIKEKTNRA